MHSEYRTVDAIGYVHKFRFEGRDEAGHSTNQIAADESPIDAPTVSLGRLLGKLALSIAVLSGLAVAGARLLF